MQFLGVQQTEGAGAIGAERQALVGRACGD